MDELRRRALRLASELPRGSEARREILGALRREGDQVSRVLKVEIRRGGEVLEVDYGSVNRGGAPLGSISEEAKTLHKGVKRFAQTLGRRLGTKVDVWTPSVEHAWVRGEAGEVQTSVRATYSIGSPPEDSDDLEDALYGADTGMSYKLDISYG